MENFWICYCEQFCFVFIFPLATDSVGLRFHPAAPNLGLHMVAGQIGGRAEQRNVAHKPPNINRGPIPAFPTGHENFTKNPRPSPPAPFGALHLHRLHPPARATTTTCPILSTTACGSSPRRPNCSNPPPTHSPPPRWTFLGSPACLKPRRFSPWCPSWTWTAPSWRSSAEKPRRSRIW